MKKKLLYIVSILLAITIIISIVIVTKYKYESKNISYEDYIIELNENYGEDKNKILNKLNEEISNNKNSKKYIGVNLIAKEHYFYIWKQHDDVIKNFLETEKYLIKYNMEHELLHLYELVSSSYIHDELYNEAYIYINKEESITKRLYEEDRSEEMLSNLTAIKYLKAIIGVDIGLDKQADVIFNEAEELRKECETERVDIYSNILLYYYDKNEYDLVEEYAFKTIDLINEKDPEYKLYEGQYIRAKRILAENYIYMGDIDKAVEITKELTANKKSFEGKSRGYAMYFLYGKIYKYYGDSQGCINNLKIAYDEIKDTELKIKKIKIAEQIIQELKLTENKKELLYWYEIENELITNMQSFLDTQYLLSQLIDTDLQNANYNIEILQLQRSRLAYIIITLLLGTIIIIIIAVVEKKHKKLLKDNIIILEKNDIIKQQYYENIKENQENIRKIKHDIKNHIILINKLLEEREFEETKRYIKGIEKRVDNNNLMVNTNNKVVDAIVFNKLEICKLEEIDLELDIKIPKELQIDEFDICVIYGNLLDNAIEACRKINGEEIKKYIKLKSLVKGDYLFINIKNSKIEEISIRDGNYITNKNDKLNHGIGIRSVNSSIKKYDGEIKIDYTEYEFNVSVIINIDQTDKKQQ